MARVRASVVVSSLVLLGAAATGTASAPSLSQLRVCGHDQVPFQGSSCASDQSRAALNANEFDCSVRATTPRAASLQGQFLYEGQVQFQASSRLRRGSAVRFIGVYFHDTKMPAGSYACRFTLGHRHLVRSFTGHGPTGNVLGPSVCLSTHRVGTDECPSDESGTALPPTSGVTCDAVFARERGRSATIELLDAAGNVLGTRQDSLSFPITEAGATFTNPSGNYFPGYYDCAFIVGGQRADRQFVVSGPKPPGY